MIVQVIVVLNRTVVQQDYNYPDNHAPPTDKLSSYFIVFCYSFVNCGFKDQSATASSCMQEKSSGTQGMCSISASCICFKLWLVYNIITIQKH